MRHFSSNNLRDEKKGPIKFLFLFFSWCVFSQGLSLFLVPLRPVCSDCQKVAPFLAFFPATHRQELCAPFSKHLDLCASPKRNDSKTSWPLRLDRHILDVVRINPRFLSVRLPILIYIRPISYSIYAKHPIQLTGENGHVVRQVRKVHSF